MKRINPNIAHEIVQGTSCPYARHAEVATDRIVPEEDAPIEPMVWSRLCEYTADELSTYPDGLLLEFPNAVLGADRPSHEEVAWPADQLKALSIQFNRLCRYFVAREYGPYYQEDVEYLRGIPDWQIKVRGVGFFAIVFSSLYTENHPRHVPAEDRSIAFFQPQSSFDAHIPENRKWEAREAVRRVFAKGGKPYYKQGGRAALMIMGLDPERPRDMEAEPWWKAGA